MIGGLLKSASRLALVAAAGVIVGGYAGYTTQAKAADLGGDCCADLEERVAELEATTARKGNRKVSLQVYGQVNEMVLFWDDGFTSDVYQVTNNVSRNRFGFRGSAKIDSDWSAGYRIEIGLRTASSGSVSQVDDDVAPFGPGDDGAGNQIDLRHNVWWVDSKTFGRLSVGQTDTPMSGAFTVNLANVPHVDAGYDDWGGGFFVRGADGTFTDTTWGDLVNPVSGTLSLSRQNEVMYTTPEFAGFQAQAAWGSADFWAVALQYAGEFSGFRLAAKVAYTDISDPDFGCETVGGGGAIPGVVNVGESDCQMWATSGSIMHVPTGLYVSGGYGELTDDLRGAGFDDNDVSWRVEGGIEQKWFAIGKTTIYGEYGEQENGTVLAGYGGATISSWGLGLVQSVDAAAMDFYIAYRNHTAEAPDAAFDNGVGAVAPEDLQLIGVGAIIKF